MTELILIGASGLAREVIALLRSAGDPRTLAIVDDAPARWGTLVDGVPVAGPVADVQDRGEAQLLLCVGHGAVRARLAGRLADAGVLPARFATVVHNGVDVPAGCGIGAGSIVLAGAVFTADVTIGSHVVLMPNVTLTHGDRIDSFATLCAGVSLGGDVRIGAAAYLGMNSAVKERVTVGPGAVIGMGAAVVADVPAEETWLGIPARHHMRRVLI